MSEKTCPAQNGLEKFLLSEMPENQKDTLELHLAECAVCRRGLALMFSENAESTEIFETPASLIETAKNLPERKSKANAARGFSFDWFKTNRLRIAFAAAVLLVCFGVFGIYVVQFRQKPDADDVLRNGAANKNSVKLLAPETDWEISGEKIEFRWSETPNAKKYTLVLSDEKGDLFKEISTEKTQIETTASALGLTKEKRYFWHVKVKSTDGLTSESETRKLFAK